MLVQPGPHQDVEMCQLHICEVSEPSTLVLTLLWKMKHHHHHGKIKVNGFPVPHIIHPSSFLVQQAWPRLEQRLLAKCPKWAVLFVGEHRLVFAAVRWECVQSLVVLARTYRHEASRTSPVSDSQQSSPLVHVGPINYNTVLNHYKLTTAQHILHTTMVLIQPVCLDMRIFVFIFTPGLSLLSILYSNGPTDRQLDASNCLVNWPFLLHTKI